MNLPSMLDKAAGTFPLFARKTSLTLLLAVWPLLSLPSVNWAAADGEKPTGPVHLRVSVDREEITIGDHLRYTFTISAEPGVDVAVPLFHERIGDFDIIDFGREPDQLQAERTILTQWYTLAIFTTGYHMLPAPRQPARGHGRGAAGPRGELAHTGGAADRYSRRQTARRRPL